MTSVLLIRDIANRSTKSKARWNAYSTASSTATTNTVSALLEGVEVETKVEQAMVEKSEGCIGKNLDRSIGGNRATVCDLGRRCRTSTFRQLMSGRIAGVHLVSQRSD